ncbi:MAG TPA: DNA starvation/stationary phase protection protein Dps [Anaerolineales bacterium]|nr:DNA starvation/stationary phase protection protein Dps [Anaerolineales bacterium]
MATKKTFSTQIDIAAETRKEMITLLNQQLADTFDLFSQTKQAHWNVKGPQFYQLHKLFDELADGLRAYVDMIAERATALGGVAQGTVRMASESSRLSEYPAGGVESMAAVEALAKGFAALGKSTRKAIDAADEAGDMDTSDLFTEVSRGLDKWIWFLEAHIQM